MRLWMQPYTPHGDSNMIPKPGAFVNMMQPYTPHGDSNHVEHRQKGGETDATLYPSRGQ